MFLSRIHCTHLQAVIMHNLERKIEFREMGDQQEGKYE